MQKVGGRGIRARGPWASAGRRSLGSGNGPLRGEGSKGQNWEGLGNQTRAVAEVVFGEAGLGSVGNWDGESLRGGVFFFFLWGGKEDGRGPGSWE